MCYASKVDRVRNNFLIDRRVNGVLAGEVVRVLFTHPNRRVDIRGTHDHDINSAPITTAGGVTKTTILEVIIIIC